ncbi:MAG: BlaI/MecI/CopY family transcriptional regulator [Acidimicrobiales bacterium]
MAKRRPKGALEHAVMAELWRAPEGLTVGEVRAALGTDLAYTTVMTILRRLWQKGSARREQRGRAFVYRSALTAADEAAERMHAAIGLVDDRQTALSRFVDGLSADDEVALRKILEEPDR